MGLINWIILRSMNKEARRLAKEVTKMYSEIRSNNPNAAETEIIKDMAFDKEALANMTEKTRRVVEICCETVQGYCYMMASAGTQKNAMGFRFIQFTYYMDKELEGKGFMPQSKKQKERILEAMGYQNYDWNDKHSLLNHILDRNVLGISDEEKISYVRVWANMKAEEAKASDELIPEFLFCTIIFGISLFDKNCLNHGEIDERVDKPYSGDSSLFEIACYIYTIIDKWIFANKPEMREQLSSYFYQQFINLFSEALPIDNVQDLFSERVEHYGELFHNGSFKNEDMEATLFYLFKLVVRTKNDTSPTKADFDKFDFTIDRELDDELSIRLLRNLKAFLVTQVPAIFKVIDNYFSATEKKKPVNRIFEAIIGIIIFFVLTFGVVAFLTYLAG